MNLFQFCSMAQDDLDSLLSISIVCDTGGTGGKIHARVKDRNLTLLIWRMKQARSANRTVGRFQSFICPRDVMA